MDYFKIAFNNDVRRRVFLIALEFIIIVACFSQIEINSAEGLNSVRTNLSGDFIQTANVDLSGYSSGRGWSPIGTSNTPFTGSYDGNGFQVKGLFINRPNDNNIGLFGFTNGAIIKNISLENVNITGKEYVGSIIGRDQSNSIIIRCNSTGDVIGTNQIGGLVGSAFSNTTITECVSIVNCSGVSGVGGLVGLVKDGTITDCFSNGQVVRISGINTLIGLFCGQANYSLVKNCYAIGSVIYEGYDNPTNKGFVGGVLNSPTFSNNYFDAEESNQNTDGSEAATAKTTPQMLQEETFTSWDFTDVWDIVEGQSYPFLRWQGGAAEHNVPVIKKSMERTGGVYQVSFTGWDGETVKISLETVEETDVEAFYTTFNSHPSIQLFNKPENIGAFFRFEVSDGTVFRNGTLLKLSFPDKPNQLWYRVAGGSWTVFAESDWSWDFAEQQAGITNLNLPVLRSESVFEFAGDNGNPGETLPVELSSFTAMVTADMTVEVHWTAETETNLLGYNLFRSESEHLSAAEKINYVIIGAHNTSITRTYSYYDESVEPGIIYYYWLQSYDLDLTHEFHGPVSVHTEDAKEEQGRIEIPFDTQLYGAFPNPFNPGTYISFALLEPSQVSLRVYDVRGNLIRVLAEQRDFPRARRHLIYWDGKDSGGNQVHSGIYFYEMKTDQGFRQINKMLMLK